MTSTKNRWLTALALGLSASYAAAQGTDRRALSAIFDDTHIVDAALPVHRHTASMPVQSRYEHLCRWVLPSADHLSFRLNLEFTPTNPAAVALHDAHRLDVQRLNRARTAVESRVQLGGHLVAPAMDLIEVASELGRLAELRDRIESAPVEDAAADVEAQQRCRLALVDMARGEFDGALASVEQLSSRYLIDRRVEFVPRVPETLVCWQGVRHQQTRDAARDLLHLIVQRDVRSGRRPNRWLAWEHHVMALAGLLSHLESEEESGQANDLYASAPNLKHWAPVSRVTAQSRGRGLPLTRWQYSRDTVQKLAGHEEDYLYYRVPLRGDFEVECDVTSFDFRDTQLLFAGNWVAPSYDLSSYTFGDLRRPLGRRELSPPMSPVDRWMRHRTVVRDGVCTTWLNGRRIHQQTLETAHDPWLAVRSAWYMAGAVQSVRVTGTPQIPGEIELASLPGLSGWSSYYERSVGGANSAWTHVRVLDGILGRLQPELRGSGVESLLQYHRPLLEDGTIEYDFFYRQGRTHTHPALDRLVFLLDPQGIRIHSATDGVFDRTTANPLGSVDEPDNRRGPDRLPLKQDSWNRLRLRLTGDIVDLILNDELVYRRELEPDNQRSFGLFHYADQTEARVRNVVWHGGWPRVLPDVEQQELGRAATDRVDEGLERLSVAVRHDFVKDGLPVDQFVVRTDGGDASKQVVAKPDGLHVTRPGRKGYTNSWVAPQAEIQGDFDITAKFEDLRFTPSDSGSGGISLTVILENDGYTHGAVHRGAIFESASVARHFIQSEFIRSPNGQTRTAALGTTSDEAASGCLRLARRGEMLYSLFAENDSSQYRLVHEEKVGTEKLLLDGIRLSAAVISDDNPSGTTAVVWKQLTVRAENMVP